MRAERERIDLAAGFCACADRGVFRLMRGRVPEPHGPAVCAGQQFSVWAKGDCEYPGRAGAGAVGYLRLVRWLGPRAGTVPSFPPVARSSRRGLNAIASARPVESARIGLPSGWCVAGFHTCTVLSPSALAKNLVGAERYRERRLAGLVTACRYAPAGWPVAVSHSRAVPSSAAVARSLPSGLNATAFT